MGALDMVVAMGAVDMVAAFNREYYPMDFFSNEQSAHQ